MIAIFVIAGAGGLRMSGATSALDRFLWELRFKTDERPVTREIIVIDIDAKSLEALGVWPLPRRLFARLTDTLAAGGASDIVFDIDFSAASDPQDDALLAESFARAGNVSLAVFRQAASAARGAAAADLAEVTNQPIPELLETAWPVVVMVPMEQDSRIWRNLYGYPIDGTSELSAAALLGEHSGATEGAFWLDYSIAVDRIDRLSLVDVLDGTARPDLFRDRKVIIGASAQELRDLFAVPKYGILPGSMIQALGAETLMQSRALAPAGEMFAVVAAVTVLLLLLFTKVEGWPIKIGILALAAAALEVVAYRFQVSSPVLVQTASAHMVLSLAAASVVVRELGFHKLLSRVATIRRHDSERMLGLVFDDSFDAIIVLQGNGEITAASQMARRLFGCERPVGRQAQRILPLELVEEALSVIAAPHGRNPVPKTVTTQAGDGERRHIEYVVTRSERMLAPTSLSKAPATQVVACLTCRDVTAERESAARLSYLARFDAVTGLPNRNGFSEDVETALQGARGAGRDLCVLQFAIVNLDQIVASLGFSYGDQLRNAIGARLLNHLSRKARWAAISADVFAGVFPCGPEGDQDMIDALKQLIGEDYKIDGARISVQLKFGHVIAGAGVPAETLLKKSGNALAKVRRDPQGQTLAFRPEMDAALQRRRLLETELFKAIMRDEIHLAYQPLVNLSDGSIYGVEALLRWTHGELGPISPAEFVPIAEENGYVVELGAWALNRAMKEAQTWSRALRLSVNVSAIQFGRGNVVATVTEALQRTGFPAERLDLEITESLFIDESLDLDFCMQELKALGCSFSLDDFGTGYSSLGYLPRYPFSKIKLDKSFVPEEAFTRQDRSVIEAVMHLARGHDMAVIVEGIETAAQAARLRDLGCQLGQGYLYGRPVSAAEIATLLVEAA